MDKINGLTNALAEFVTEYADTHEMTFNDVMNALAHTFVIYGFALKAENVTDDTMEESLVYCVEQSIGFLRGMRDAQEA
jgi:hypothetical protein